MDASIGSRVTTISAQDPDTFTSTNVTYTLEGVTSRNAHRAQDTTQITSDLFAVNASSGDVNTLSLMERFREHYFKLMLNARDVDGLNSQGNLTVYIYRILPSKRPPMV